MFVIPPAMFIEGFNMALMRFGLVCALTMALAACGGGGGCDAALGALSNCDRSSTPPPVNLPPVASAGTVTSTVIVGRDVMLNGLDSRDPEGQALRYAWRIQSQPYASNPALLSTLAGADRARPSFRPLQAGEYVFELTVNDGVQDSRVSLVSVVAAVSSVPPVAVVQANPASVVLTGAVPVQLVTLDGSGSTVGNGDSLTYRWRVVDPTNTTVTLQAPSGVKSSFIPDRLGTYVVTLVVNDGLLDSAAATVTVAVTNGNVAPVAYAGKDLTGAVGVTVALDGSGSTDANGDTLKYLWKRVYWPKDSQNNESTADLLSTTSPKPVFVPDMVGLYVFSLVVEDALSVRSQESFVSVTVK